MKNVDDVGGLDIIIYRWVGAKEKKRESSVWTRGDKGFYTLSHSLSEKLLVYFLINSLHSIFRVCDKDGVCRRERGK